VDPDYPGCQDQGHHQRGGNPHHGLR
jgi:hypothetical protein